jgi:hypothetical protein
MKDEIDTEAQERGDTREKADRRAPVVTRQDIEEERRSEEESTREEPIRDRQRERPRAAAPETDTEPTRLFEGDRMTELKRRWTDIQAQFVDDPRDAVKSADSLVDDVIRDLSTLFSDERSKLESQWGKNEEVSTEDLRVALRRYRAFFERLLSV